MQNNQKTCIPWIEEGKEAYTTWQAAKKLRVAYQTIALWERHGYIKCFRTKGGINPGHRRVPADEVKRVFMEMYSERNSNISK